MKYSLDTNTCIRAINGRMPQVRASLLAVASEEVLICSVVRAELFAGVRKSQTPAQSIAKQTVFLQPFKSLPFDDAAAQEYGVLRAALEQTGKTIGPLDMLIAAILLSHHLILVTHNTAEFSRISRLKLLDWEV